MNSLFEFRDPLYGVIRLPASIASLVLTPEVRRLSRVRLSNTLSPTLATFGELRRFSHTLGVLALCTHSPLSGFRFEERQALAASVLLHDIGTPPFGHLFEYHLKERFGWSHERIIPEVLWGRHAPENRAHQMVPGQPIRFREELSRASISLEIVESIVRKQHPLSALLFGSIDLDNLDNVARAAWSLGLMPVDVFSARLAKELQVNKRHELLLSVENGRPFVEQWAHLRRGVYELLAFDPLTMASQAVLFDAIQIALQKEWLLETDWMMTDEQLIERLRDLPETKPAVLREYFGSPPQMLFCIQLRGGMEDFKLSGRYGSNLRIEQVLKAHFSTERTMGHTVVDDGAFSKGLVFVDPGTSKTWTYGSTSRSVLLYGFQRTRGAISENRCRRAARAILEDFGAPDEAIIRVLIGPSAKPSYAAKRLSLTSSGD